MIHRPRLGHEGWRALEAMVRTFGSPEEIMEDALADLAPCIRAGFIYGSTARGGCRFVSRGTVPLVLEYEEVLKRQEKVPLSEQEVDDVLDYLCRVANHREIYFLWRPFLRDRGDDLVLEVAVSAGADAILTHEQRGFEGVESTFGVRGLTPGAFLRELETP